MPFEDQELVAEFVTESNEHLADVENQLLEIESGGPDVDPDLVNTVFRAVHSVKGAAGFLGLETINKLAHSLENVLNKIRSDELVPDPTNTDVMLRAADMLRNLLNDTENSNSVDVSDLAQELDGVAETGGATTGSEPETAAGSAAPPPEPAALPVGAADKTEAGNAEATAADAKESSPAVNVAAQSSTPAPAARPTSTSNNTAGNAASDSSIRVSVHVLDQLMNLAGELVLSRNQLLQAVALRDSTGLDVAAAGLDHVTSELQETIMQTRMQPIGNVFNKFPRIIRDLSAKLGKQCSLEVEGKDVEVDKTIVEAIGDPLTHLVRNSVDHGVETPDIRSKRGKAPEGTVYLRAFHKAGKVCIEIEDDGAGIDPEILKAKAVEKGILSPDQADQMCDRDAVRLIFHAGFSTAEKVSDVSGRGVGMDVVRTNIERLGGNVDVESEVGCGSKIVVTLPLTLAIIPSMIVKCSSNRYALPQVNIVELVRLRPGEVADRVGQVKGAEVLRLRGALLPLLRLSSALDIESREEPGDEEGPLYVVVVETGQVRYGLVVDGIDDSEEIVVKPLGQHLKSCNEFAGATILGDGRVALILDVAGIASRADLQLAAGADATDLDEAEAKAMTADAQSLLLFSSDPSDQFAVPMEVVDRIERIRSDQVDSVAGCHILQYRGMSLPLIAVDDCLEVKPRPELMHVSVIVFSTAGREVGLIAPHLDDIREIEAKVDVNMFDEQGVAGSVVIDARATRILDVFAMAEVIHPQWFTRDHDDGDSDATNATLLLAEDSDFFRKQVSGFLRTEGFVVIEACDGQEAWETLVERAAEIDMVVTDIEMPRLDGFDLCRQIKGHAEYQAFPVVALTSLSSDEHLKRGQEVGFDGYEVKLQKDKLLAAVEKFVGSTSGRKSAPTRAADAAGAK